MTKTKSRIDSSSTTFKICLTSCLLSLSVVLDLLFKFIPGLTLPQGGHLTLFMLPMVYICLFCGPVFGFIAGISYSIINFLLDGAILYSIWSLLLDYILAFGLIGFTGFLNKMFYRSKTLKSQYFIVVLALFIGTVIRYLCSGLSGAIIFAKYAPEGVNSWFYSFVLYNLPYIWASFACCVALAAVLILPIRILTESQIIKNIIPKNVTVTLIAKKEENAEKTNTEIKNTAINDNEIESKR